MNICELINECGGPDKVGIQYLDRCADSMDWKAGRGTTVKFGTDQPLTPNGLAKCGIVVWLDRDAVKAAIAKARATPPAEPQGEEA